MRLFTARDRRLVVLGREIARGGEGAIYTVEGDSTRLAKRFLTAPSAERIEKLRAMSGLAYESLIRVTAWPTDLLVPGPSDPINKAVAFLMPRAPAPDQLHELYTPRSRQQSFPQADLRFLLHVAANVVRAFGTVHRAGHVVGDVNHGHLLVGEDGRVTLIDCDSFQISAYGKLFTCDVGVPLFTAPELQGRSFRGLVRTADHDRFGLAVLLFHLLFMGRHPYAGVPLDLRQPADIEAAIRAGRFAYGACRRQLGVDQPPGTIPLETFGQRIAILFESAFANPLINGRPNEKDWLEGLIDVQQSLRPCRTSSAHQVPGHLPNCPWCALEARTGLRLFGTKIQTKPGSETVDLAALWHAIEAAPRPPPVKDVATDALKLPPPTAADLARRRSRVQRQVGSVIAFFAVLVALMIANAPFWGLVGGAVLAAVVWPKPDEVARRQARDRVALLQADYENLVSEWRRDATDARYLQIERSLLAAKEKIAQLGAERAHRLAELTSPAKQLERYLDRFRIDGARIVGIGPGRASALASFGIETASDVSRQKILAIPGFGPGLAGNLLTWRAAHEARFQVNPNQKPDAGDVRALEAELHAQKNFQVAILRNGPAELRRAVEAADRTRHRLKPLIEQRYVELQVAKRALGEL